jgi:hypothetical protein
MGYQPVEREHTQVRHHQAVQLTPIAHNINAIDCYL